MKYGWIPLFKRVQGVRGSTALTLREISHPPRTPQGIPMLIGSLSPRDCLQCYTDAAISGASLMRPGIQQLMQDAMAGRFQIILAEALDRLSRNLADIAGLYQSLTFAGVRIVTLSEGEISELHIGLKGTMNSLQLKDLAEKVRRGLRGRVEAGKSGG